jgi:hypothetical protein
MKFLVPKLKFLTIINLLIGFKKNFLFRQFISAKDNILQGVLSQSAWSLFLICLWRKRIFKKSSITIYIPEYYCNSTLLPLRIFKFNIIFYKISNDQLPDKEYLNRLFKLTKPDIFVICNFFEKKIYDTYYKDFCLNNDCWFVEDSAHVLEHNKHDFLADFYFFSPHKILPIPMGSILLVNKDGPSKINFEQYKFMKTTASWPDQILAELKLYKLKTKKNFIFSCTWLIKRFIQTILNFDIIFHKKDFEQDSLLKSTKDFLNPRIDFFTLFLINRTFFNYYDEIDDRQRLSLVISQYIKKQNNNNFGKLNYVNDVDIDSKILPYFAIIEGDQIKSFYKFLLNNKIPCITWPDLPPEVKQGDFNQALLLRKNRIFIPLLDGRLYKKFIISENNSELDDIETIWKDFDRDEWNDYADKLESMNLTQSWDYGEFKNKYENYLIKRGIIKHKDKFIGLVQKFQKKFLFFKIDIINRGPILINTKYANLIKNKIIREKKSIFFNFLVFIPELKFHYKNIIVNKQKIFKRDSWMSSKIDLSESLELIKSNFKKKWKKDLNYALSQNNLQVKVFINYPGIEKIIQDYNKEKFKKINTDLVRYMNKNNKLITFIAFLKDENVGSLCLITHNKSATNIINPLNESGRKVKSNHLLIWSAVEHLKKKNFKYLDTGGFDYKNTYGPSKFKDGLNGKKYKLIGSTILSK